MTCSGCGQALDREARFCGRCGHRQTGELDGVRRSTSRGAVAPLAGSTLAELCAVAPIEWRRALQIIVAACHAVTAERARGIDSLSLEPECFYAEQRDGSWHVTLLASDIEDARGAAPSDTEVMPAPPWLDVPRIDYLSPERLMGKPTDGASDVYVLGAICFELVTGRRPFAEARGPAGLITAMLKQQPPVPSAIQPQARLPRAVDAVLLACLEKDRMKRFPVAGMLAQALAHVLATEPVVATGPLKRPPAVPAPSKPAPPTPTIQIVDGRTCGASTCTTPHLFRTVPTATLLGSWLYMDHFDSVVARRPESPHPHLGVVAMSYLFEGRLVHRDNLGNEQLIEPNTLSWLHAGRGVSQSERHHPVDKAREARLHGLELWAVLPRPNEDDPPAYKHHRARELISVVIGGARIRVVLGEGFGARSPVVTASPLSLFDVRMPKGAAVALPAPFHHDYQRGVYVVSGAVELDGRIIETRQLAVIPSHASVGITAARGKPAHVMLLGSAPVVGPRHSWWYFSATSKARIEEAKRRYRAGELGSIPGEPELPPLPAG